MTEAAPPFPGPLDAMWLTMGSWLATRVLLDAFVDPLGPYAALGVALALGLGVTGTLAARRVPPPQAERIGLRGFAARILPALILLVPVTLLASELNNIVSAFIPVPDAAPATPVPGEQPAIEGLLALELAVVQVGLAPVLEEFFFRGVLQQGLIASGGAMRGVLGTAFLSAIGHGYLEEQTWLAAMVSAFAAAIVFGYLRLASGSLLASILLSMAISVAGLTAMAFQHEIPIPGFNAPGAHTPIAWLLPATISVALGLLLLGRERARRDTEASLRPTLEPSNDEQS